MSMARIGTADELTAAIATGGTAPGTTVLLRAGIYRGSFVANVSGTQTAPIVFRAEGRVTIDGSLEINGSDTTWWGLEVTSTNWTTRSTVQSGGNPTDMPGYRDRFIMQGARTKWINCIAHDLGEAEAWSAAPDSEIYGCLFYNNGWLSTNDRGHGHSLYTQNDTGSKLYESNIILKGYSDYGLHAYGQDGQLKNMTFRKNVHVGVDWLTGGGNPLQNLVLDRNVIHQGGVYIGYPNGGVSNANATLTSNIFSSNTVLVDALTFMTGSGNVFQGSGDMLRRKTAGTWNWDTNRYYAPFSTASIQFQYGATQMDFATWKSTTGLDLVSSTVYSNTGPTTAIVIPNRYDRDRAIVVARNWTSAGTVSVDLPGMPYRTYRLRNALNYYGDAPIGFTYTGSPITIPMTGWSVAVPTSASVAVMATTYPTFGVFMVTPS